jgi:hypothetical protein
MKQVVEESQMGPRFRQGFQSRPKCSWDHYQQKLQCFGNHNPEVNPIARLLPEEQLIAQLTSVVDFEQQLQNL